MEILTSNKFKEERRIAYGVIEKIKSAAMTIESNDPTHMNGVKFRISKKEYHNIVDSEFDKKCNDIMNKELIKNFITLKLKKL